MINMILMGDGGSLNPERVVMVASLKSAPIKRLLRKQDAARIVDLTYGYPQRSLVIFDNGMMAITRYDVPELSFALRIGKEIKDGEDIPF